MSNFSLLRAPWFFFSWWTAFLSSSPFCDMQLLVWLNFIQGPWKCYFSFIRQNQKCPHPNHWIQNQQNGKNQWNIPSVSVRLFSQNLCRICKKARNILSNRKCRKKKMAQQKYENISGRGENKTINTKRLKNVEQHKCIYVNVFWPTVRKQHLEFIIFQLCKSFAHLWSSENLWSF